MRFSLPMRSPQVFVVRKAIIGIANSTSQNIEDLYSEEKERLYAENKYGSLGMGTIDLPSGGGLSVS